MSQVDALHAHPVYDDDNYFIIDPNTRSITSNSDYPHVVMQYDHNSERYTFEIPRYVEGHDMTKCTAVKIHYNNVDSETDVENADVYDSTDLHIDPNDSDKVLCSWLISRDATQLVGIISFIVQYLCTDESGNVVYEWHSDIYYEVEVKAGRNNGEHVVREYNDLLEQWRARLFGEGESAVSKINETFENKKSELIAESQTQQDNIVAQGEATLATIPEDYTTTYNMADLALRKKADAVILSESGEYIFLDDSSDCNLIGLNLYGRTTQVKTTGKNLFKPPVNDTQMGVTLTKVDDYFVLNGTATGSFNFIATGSLDAGTYTLSANNPAHSNIEFPIIQVYIPSSTAMLSVIDNGINGVVIGSLESSDQYQFRIRIEQGVTYNNYIVKPQLELGSTATSYEPYSGGVASPSPEWSQELESVVDFTTYIIGKNLFNPSDVVLDRISVDDGKYIFNEIGSIDHTRIRVPEIPHIIFGESYTLSCTVKNNWTDQISIDVGYDFGGHGWTRISYVAVGETKRISIVRNAVDTLNYGKRLLLGSNTVGSSFEIYDIQIELGTEATEYEPPKTVQTNFISNTLHGIPVSQNGNYADAAGQQWACDEIDFERGKYIQRVKRLTLSPELNWNKGADDQQTANTNLFYVLISDKMPNSDMLMCDSLPVRHVVGANNDFIGIWGHPISKTIYVRLNGQYTLDEYKEWLTDNPIELLYPLFEFIETDLTPAELQVFKALHTNATNTTILNDQNAYMAVKYIADLKQYIQKNVSVKEDLFELTLKEANWVASSDERYYSQVVDYKPRHNGRINLCPTAAQQVSLILDGIAMFVANENGIATAYCISSTPGKDITIQASEQVVVFV